MAAGRALRITSLCSVLKNRCRDPEAEWEGDHAAVSSLQSENGISNHAFSPSACKVLRHVHIEAC